MRHLLALFVLFLSTPLIASEPDYALEAEPEVYGEKSSSDLALEKHILHSFLLDHEPLDSDSLHPITVHVDSAERKRLTAPDKRPTLIGVHVPVDLEVRFGSKSAFGSWKRVGTSWVWNASFRSPGATSVSLFLSDLNFFSDASIFVYNESGEAFGPFLRTEESSRKSFWTPSVSGDEIRLQVHLETGVSKPARRSGSLFRVGKVDHQETAPTKSFCDNSCQVNLSCKNDIPLSILFAKHGIFEISYREGGRTHGCSASLLVDNDIWSERMFILTAAHCLYLPEHLESLDVKYNFTSPCGSCEYDGGSSLSEFGLDDPIYRFVSIDGTRDQTLIEVSNFKIIPGMTALGWTTDPVATSYDYLYRLAHPRGLPMSYLSHQVDPHSAVHSTAPRGQYIYSKNLEGWPEPGASGSSLLNFDGKVVGVLSGVYPDDNLQCGPSQTRALDSSFSNGYHFKLRNYLGDKNGFEYLSLKHPKAGSIGPSLFIRGIVAPMGEGKGKDDSYTNYATCGLDFAGYYGYEERHAHANCYTVPSSFNLESVLESHTPNSVGGIVEYAISGYLRTAGGSPMGFEWGTKDSNGIRHAKFDLTGRADLITITADKDTTKATISTSVSANEKCYLQWSDKTLTDKNHHKIIQWACGSPDAPLPPRTHFSVEVAR